MFEPDDPLKPPAAVFEEAWQAQTLAMADAMVRVGHFTATEWAKALGAELKTCDAAGKPDTQETYYMAALAALEGLSATAGITRAEQTQRREDWESAYLNTPHGRPVMLGAEQSQE